MKVSLLASAIAALTMSGAAINSVNTAKLPERDTNVIVELERGLDGLSEEGIENSQNAILRNIRASGISNYNVISRFSVLNNAVALSVNSSDVDAIREVPGVKSVTVEKIHWKKVINNDEIISISREPEQLVEENISATTMNKPTETNDGEGTVIAILDNEFYFQGATATQEAWHHETFGALPEGTATRFTFDNLTSVVKKTAGKRKSKTVAGQEGSLYFNNKVPYYYDYGGDSTDYGKVGAMDYDVHTANSYHGSHVASIAAGNAPTYKGISPKAQLVCMKVFTEYTADKVAEDLGFQSSTGAYDIPILTALEDCIKLGVDGINMSLGSDLDDFDGDSITLKTLSKLANSGIMTSISAGNSGKASYSFTGGYGNWTTDMVETGILSSYANNKDVMTIAAGQPDQIYYENAFRIGGHNVAYEDQIVNREGLAAEFDVEYKMTDLAAGGKTEFEYVYVGGFGTDANYSGLDVEGKIAIVNRGSTNFADKYDKALAHGAIALVIVNNDPTAAEFNFRCSFGDDFNPSMPCALVLYKDKPFFESNRFGTFELLSKEVSANDSKRTLSTFSSDGATYDFDLKPEITAPGESIRGAVPPQKKEDRENTPLTTYEYLSGTSMSAPNYAGAQALVLSERAKDVYSVAEPDKAAVKALGEYRKTIDMRLMSTAKPMLDVNDNPETGVKTLTSPRMQGAGMVDLGGALNTDVYLEGLDLQGKKINKSKIALHNNADIAKGDVKLSFLAHNESEESRTYNVTLTVMRPAVAMANDVLSEDFKFNSKEIDAIDKIPYLKYYDSINEVMKTGTGKVEEKEAIKLTRVIEYYASEEAFAKDEKTTMMPGYWYYDFNAKQWLETPDQAFQSIQDVEIAKITGQTVTVPAGESTVTINTYSLSEEVKADILNKFKYGCAIEGFVTLESTDGHEDLGIPYLGFYSGTDKDSEASYASAPVVEPFSFEKDPSVIYPSDLVNDIAKSLVGKDNADMGSMMVTGYAKEPQSIDMEAVTANDTKFSKMAGFHEVGTDPKNGAMMSNPGDNIYVGNPETTNTLIVQQFVLRSVSDNYFTITNKETGEIVHKDVLEDILFGETGGKYPLYKSHVDSSYLGAGYVAHRAYAIIPLYNELNRVPFASGEYEITFNYLLAATNTWTSKSYSLHIDSDAPEFKGVKEYTNDSGVDMVRFDFNESRLSYAKIGTVRCTPMYDAETKTYYFEDTKEKVMSAMESLGCTSMGQTRLYVEAVDFAYGKTGVTMHFADDTDFNSELQYISSAKLSSSMDFIVTGNEISFIEIDKDGNESPVIIDNYQSFGIIAPVPPKKGGCGGNAITSCVLLAVVASMSLSMLFFLRRKKQLGGK